MRAVTERQKLENGRSVGLPGKGTSSLGAQSCLGPYPTAISANSRQHTPTRARSEVQRENHNIASGKCVTSHRDSDATARVTLTALRQVQFLWHVPVLRCISHAVGKDSNRKRAGLCNVSKWRWLIGKSHCGETACPRPGRDARRVGRLSGKLQRQFLQTSDHCVLFLPGSLPFYHSGAS